MNLIINGKVLAWLTVFLQNENLWEKYRKEHQNQNKESIAVNLLDKNSSEAIDRSFVFNKTDGGYRFWQDVSINWRVYLDKKLLEIK